MTKFQGLLGILNRGGKLLIGSSIPESLHNVSLIIYASDASENTLNKYLPKAEYYCIKTICVDSKRSLGNAIGYDEISLIAIKDQKATKALINAWEGNKDEKR